jgi:hypothetical protein
LHGADRLEVDVVHVAHVPGRQRAGLVFVRVARRRLVVEGHVGVHVVGAPAVVGGEGDGRARGGDQEDVQVIGRRVLDAEAYVDVDDLADQVDVQDRDEGAVVGNGGAVVRTDDHRRGHAREGGRIGEGGQGAHEHRQHGDRCDARHRGTCKRPAGRLPCGMLRHGT